MTLALVMSFAAPASAAPLAPQAGEQSFAASPSQELEYQVEPAASTQNLIPDLEITFEANAGSTTYLRALNLSTTNVTPLELGDNIGNTFWGSCRYASGATISGALKHYWASNLVPPAETSIVPQLRWLFVAPINDTYTCEVAVSGYSTIIHSGREVTMRIPAGATLAGQTFAEADKWSLALADSETITVGNTATVLENTYQIASAGDITLDADLAISTCKYLSSICPGGQSNILSSTAQIAIEAQPLTAGDLACGPLVSSGPVTNSISSPKHHLTMINSLTLDADDLTGCSSIAVSVKVSAIDGNPIYVHGSSSTVASRVVAYEHQAQQATWNFADSQAHFPAATIVNDISAPSGDGQVATLTSSTGTTSSNSDSMAVSAGSLVSVAGDWKLSGHGTELQLCFDVGGCQSVQSLGSLAGTTLYDTDWAPFRLEAEAPAGASSAYLSWSVASDGFVDGFDWDITSSNDFFEPGITPIAQWQLDETSGTAASDSSGNDHHGTYIGGVTLAQDSLLPADASGSAVHFNGTNAQMATNSALPAFSPSRSLEAWIQPQANVTGVIVGASTSQAYLARTSAGALRMAWRNPSGTGIVLDSATGLLVMGETYYVTGTHDGTTARLYINGVEVASSSANAAGSIPSVVWRVGSLTSSQWFNGVIDNAFVYSAELPAEDVLAHYEAGAFMAPLSDDATGNTIVDVVTTITVTAPALLDFGVGLPSDTLNVSDGVTVITNNSSGYTLSFVVNDLSSLDTTDTIPASAVSATLDGQASVGSSGRTSAAGTTFNLEAELILPFVDSGVYNGSIVFTAVTQ